MNELKNKEEDLIYSRAVKAGKRIYYLDAKQNFKGDYFLSITESKKKIGGENGESVSFGHHKVFLYQEDFEKFTSGLNDVISFINGIGPINETDGDKSTEGESL